MKPIGNHTSYFSEVHFDKYGLCAITRGYVVIPPKTSPSKWIDGGISAFAAQERDAINALKELTVNVGDECDTHPVLVCTAKWCARGDINDRYLLVVEFERP